MSPERRPTLVLVGPPGAGKTTVGQVLARRLKVGFTDVDALIQQRADKTIADMFTQDGEPAFRLLEREVVAEALISTDGVLALGGGSVLAAETRIRLRGHRVVYLSVGLTDGLRRTGMSTARPLLAGVNPRATFRALLVARAPLYREVATVEIDTVRRSANQVARAVLEALGEEPGEAVRSTAVPDPLDRPTPRDAVALPDPTVRPDPAALDPMATPDPTVLDPAAPRGPSAPHGSAAMPGPTVPGQGSTLRIRRP
ncbi:MAG: shikimate kinase [Pseudonocardia sp.]